MSEEYSYTVDNRNYKNNLRSNEKKKKRKKWLVFHRAALLGTIYCPERAQILSLGVQTDRYWPGGGGSGIHLRFLITLLPLKKDDDDDGDDDGDDNDDYDKKQQPCSQQKT